MVEMLSGKDRSKRGKILVVLPESRKVIVEGLNIVKKHKRPKKAGQKGEIIQVARAVDVSKVVIVCPKCGSRTRVRFQFSESGKKLRICKKCGSEL